MSRTLLATQSSAVHGLAHYPQDDTNGIFYSHVVLVLLLEQALCGAFRRRSFSLVLLFVTPVGINPPLFAPMQVAFQPE
jgi:hypothetical protein